MKTWQKIVGVTVWLIAIAGGMFVLLAHTYTAAPDDGPAPKTWPAQCTIPTTPGKPTLVMFIHPKCPCTRATMTELAQLMSRGQGLVNANVMAVRPQGADANWVRTELCSEAAAIPGVTVRVDQDGLEARRFHASASGHVVLYDGGGQLLFSGGITIARGHEGDSTGLLAILDMLHGRTAAAQSAPVYGCPLLNSTSSCKSKTPSP